MPKRKWNSLSTPELLILAYDRINQSREDLQHLQRRMEEFESRYSNRSWSTPESVLDFPAIIAQREYINRLPLGKKPVDFADWLIGTHDPVVDET